MQGKEIAMAHFAEIDENNIVTRVLVVDDAYEDSGQEFLAETMGFGGTWIRTSYNTFGGVHKNGKTTVPKAVITCTVCKKNGHDAQGCWFNAENKLKEAAKMKSDAEDCLKSKKSNKKALMAGFVANEQNEECLNCVSLKCYRACADTYAMQS
jgi:hypothetical protein